MRKWVREEQERRERPIREAEKRIQATHRKLAEAQRERLTNPDVRDVDLFVSRDVVGASMPEADAVKFNLYHARLFAEEHPEFVPTSHNIRLLGNYFEKHGINIVTFEMIEKLYLRMIEAGVIFDQKEPVPEPQHKPEPTFVNLTIQPARVPKTYKGRDYATGLDREFSEREVNRMSSLEYRRAFPVAETVAELLTSMSNERNQRD